MHRVSSSLLGSVVSSIGALSGRIQFTVRRHKFTKKSLLSPVRGLQVVPPKRSSRTRCYRSRIRSSPCDDHTKLRPSCAAFQVRDARITIAAPPRECFKRWRRSRSPESSPHAMRWKRIRSRPIRRASILMLGSALFQALSHAHGSSTQPLRKQWRRQ